RSCSFDLPVHGFVRGVLLGFFMGHRRRLYRRADLDCRGVALRQTPSDSGHRGRIRNPSWRQQVINVKVIAYPPQPFAAAWLKNGPAHMTARAVRPGETQASSVWLDTQPP